MKSLKNVFERKNFFIVCQTQKYIEASELVMGPVVENVRPLQSQKIWEDLRYVVVYFVFSVIAEHKTFVNIVK